MLRVARKNLKRYALRYTVVTGLPSGAAILGLAVWQGVPLALISLLVTLVAVTLACLIVGVNDTGIETASAGAVGGFMSGSDAQKYQSSELPIPDRLAIVCWLVGVSVVGLVGLVVA